MIDRQQLLKDLQSLLSTLEADLLERSDSDDVPEVGEWLRAEYAKAKDADRTAHSFEQWRSDAITQAAAAWVLSCVFTRFLEDNELVDPPRISGQTSEVRGRKSEVSEQTQNRLQRARDEHEVYFRAHPTETDREYLLHVFDELATRPGASDIFGEHNPIRELPNWLSGDGAGELLGFFQRIDADTGALLHDFTDPDWDTRFLGDLYQDLSEAARKKYALLQTPEFIEEFILDRTLEPALDEFGLLPPHPLGEGRGEGSSESTASFRMIDPACGSGHFLLGAFPRILSRWQSQEPGTNVRELVQRTLDSIHGVDLNPYAVAIARFRLLLLALRACDVKRLANAPAFRMSLACGDSLLHGSAEGDQLSLGWHELDHVYQVEDAALLRRMLKPGQYHAVVANPPYITPKDRALNQAYRERFKSCHMKYSLAAPFMEQLFRLAVRGSVTPRRKDAKEGAGVRPDPSSLSASAPLREAPSGFIGQITANSFMKREFGKKLIQEFLPTIDLTHVIDTSGAYIPGHGTPTVILFGQNRPPVASTVRAVMGIRGEPSTPGDAAHGLVWTAIEEQIDQPGSESEFVSVGDSDRALFYTHPWSIGGGGAAELKEQVDSAGEVTLGTLVESIGPPSFAGVDDMFFSTGPALRRKGVGPALIRPLCNGDVIRDWRIVPDIECLVPYDQRNELLPYDWEASWARYVWLTRVASEGMISFNKKTRRDLGEPWWSWYRWIRERLNTPLSIALAFVATHNHFVLDRGGKVFKQSAPVIKLPADATEDGHLALLGLLNSSTACFWMKQIFHNKGSSVDQHGARQTTIPFENFWEHDGTKLKQFPIPAERPQHLPRFLDQIAQELAGFSPEAIVKLGPVTARGLEMAKLGVKVARRQMIASQEELDWQCYQLYGLTEQGLRCLGMAPGLELGQRAFEIVMARKMITGELKTTWFERHGSTPITELPDDWPDDYRQVVERRIELIGTDKNIGLIEQPEYKRRWNTEPWESQLERALRSWLLDRLEGYFDFDGRMEDLTQRREGAEGEEGPENLGVLAPLREIQLVSTARIADVASKDADFMQVAELYCDDPAFDVQPLVDELVADQSVPLLPVLRYKATGLRKRVEWEKTWELQREEDRLTQRREDAKVGSERENLGGYVAPGEAAEAKNQTTPRHRDAMEGSEPSSLSAFAPLREIPVPPKYKSSDFLKTSYWRLRGKLDVPKERWVSFPHCEGEDGTPVVAWAGYDHLQLAKAISAFYVDVQERLGGRDDPRLEPLLAALIELLPWLKQWHNDVDPEFGMAMGDYFEGFIQEEARQMGKTVEEVRAWEPPKKAKRTRRKK